MKKYGVYVPMAGYIYREIEANNKEEALNKLVEEGYDYEDITGLVMYNDIVKEVIDEWIKEID
ncbi:hypothetical protein GNF77_14650 [Clostridium perfringens]|uniref:Uncharacterized protein n=1 Tax=Clostridium perfringens TaxID=1502 RepID=A0AAW9IRM5_CLOPF|nr:hypothetical protein [Clostridium perfringens]MDZ5010130.1 hypothetical protein [Clostridium perfringens]